MAISKIYSKTLGQIVADGKTEVNYAGTKTVCTAIEKVNDTTAKVYFTSNTFAPKYAKGVWELGAVVKPVDDITATVADVTAWEEEVTPVVSVEEEDLNLPEGKGDEDTQTITGGGASMINGDNIDDNI